MTKRTKPFMYKGEELTEERAAQIAEETLAELDAMSDEEYRSRIRPPGTLETRMGRPRLGSGNSVQIRTRLAPELAGDLDAFGERTGRRRSDIVREALSEYLDRHAS